MNSLKGCNKMNKNMTDDKKKNEYAVFSPAVDFGSQYFRIPFCEITNNGVIIAGSDIRYKGAGDLQKIDVGIARSLDGGLSWQDKQKVFINNGICDNSRKMDAAILVDRKNNRVFLFAHCIDSDLAWERTLDASTISTHFIYKFSDDDGLTWSREFNLDYLKTPEMVTLFDGVGHGITMSDGTLVVPVQAKIGGTLKSGIIFSLDRGETWRLSSLLPVLSSECMAAEYKEDCLMLNCRSYISKRRVYITSDMGKTWIPHESDKTIIEPFACQGCFDKIKIDDCEYGLFSNPHSLSKRENITVQITKDYVHWRKIYSLNDEPTGGYTCMANYNGIYGLVTERNGYILCHRLDYLIEDIKSVDFSMMK